MEKSKEISGICYQHNLCVSSNVTTAGITLVALVVTIVVLLILAGITIVYVFGDNGIFKLAQDAKDKTEQAKKDEQEYFSNVVNMINEYANGISNEGETTNPPTPPTPAEPVETPTENIKSDWETIEKIAKEIANDDTITRDSDEAAETVDDKKYTIKVGDIFEVKYNDEVKRVRVLGFKHDDLVNTGAYGGNNTKAGISFEFYDFMTGTSYMAMNSSDSNAGGWGASKMRTDLNGTGSAIGGLGVNLSNKNYIKQVTKKYIVTRNDAESVTTCNDYLWLLACSEIVPQNSSADTMYGNAITSEGSQYKYYQGVTETWYVTSYDRAKKTSESGSVNDWWLRSPNYNYSSLFGVVDTAGAVNGDTANDSRGVAPGFSI